MLKQIKLVHVISNLSFGGAQILLYDILCNLNRKENLDITLITIDSGEYIGMFEEAGIKLIDLKEKGLVNIKIFFKLKKILKKIKPDIVHTHLLKADFYGRIIAKQSRVPLIISSIHSNSTTHKIRKSSGKNIYDLIDNIVIDYSDAYLVSVSKLVRDYLIIRKKNIEDRIKIIYNGVNPDKEKNKLSNTQNEKFKKELNINNNFVISIIGRLEESKGHMFFLEAAKDFLLKTNSKLLIIGEGSLREEITQFITENKLTDNIFLLGHRNDIEELIEICDLIVVPSLWEGFGLVIIEAMIKNKTVLASNVGGIPDIITDGENGFLFESLNKKSLLENLNYIYSNAEILNSIHDNALHVVREKFDIRKNSEQYYELYIEKLKRI
ncbi:MAG: glycosyltransferase family 4 protein [Bacteroidota bacterium]|nr:glycosyltransferase family 4 protein [Bacteroidota bacterium]